MNTLPLLVCICLGVSLLLLCDAQQCKLQANTDYDGTGNLLTLYNLASADACCSACEGFEECNYFSYVSDTTSSLYQQCTIKTAQSVVVSGASPSTVAGVNSNNHYTRETSCSSESGYLYVVVGTAPLQTISNSASSSACCASCAAYVGCNYWSLTGTVCTLQSSQGKRVATVGTTSGTVIPSYITEIPEREGKKGLGLYGTSSCSDIQLLGNVSWVYNWGPHPGPLEQCLDELGIEFIPMLWSLTATIGDLYTKAKYLLTFNEPNFSDQSNMTPAQAVAAWPAIQLFANTYGMKISSPSASYGGYEDPLVWLDSFFALCPTCQVDFITTHQYDCRPVDLYGAISNFKKYNKPIWVTEFSCYGTAMTEEVSFVQSVLPLFDDDVQIERYSWFGARADQLYSVFDPSSNALSPVGIAYAGGPTSNTTTSSSTSHTTHATSSQDSGFIVSSDATHITVFLSVAMLLFFVSVMIAVV